MVRHLSWALGVCVLLMSAPASFAECLQQSDSRGQSSQPAAGAPQQPRPRFWTDPKLRQELGITDQQSAAIEEIFSKSIQSLRDARKELDQLEAVLSRTIQENTADVFFVTQLVDKVEAARSTYNKTRTVMLYRMNLVLSPDQRVKVKAMNDRYEEQRRKEEDERRKQGKSGGRH